jgi:hypothetical protein
MVSASGVIVPAASTQRCRAYHNTLSVKRPGWPRSQKAYFVGCPLLAGTLARQHGVKVIGNYHMGWMGE